MQRLVGFCSLGLALFGLMFLSGCRGGGSVKTVPVRGKITVGGQPLAAGNVSLIPIAESTKAPPSAGQVTNGEYTIYTGGKEGAPEGKYKVTVTPLMVPTGGTTAPVLPFNAKYRDAKSTPLTLVVPSSNYDLELAK